MTDRFPSEAWEERFSAYLDDALDEQGRREMEALLEENPDAAAEFAYLQQMRGALRQLPQPNAPRVVETVMNRLPEPEEDVNKITQFFKNSPLIAIMGSLSVVVVVFVGVLAWQGGPEPTETAQLSSERAPANRANRAATDDDAVRVENKLRDALEQKSNPEAGKLLEKIFRESQRRQQEGGQQAQPSEGTQRFLEILQQSQRKQEESLANLQEPVTVAAQLGVRRGAAGRPPASQAEAGNALRRALGDTAADTSGEAAPAPADEAPTGDLQSIFLRYGKVTDPPGFIIPILETKNPPANLDILSAIRGNLGTIRLAITVDREGRVTQVENQTPQGNASAHEFATKLASSAQDWAFRPARVGVQPVKTTIQLSIPQ